MKSAFVSIIGRPSAGKSTLLNKMCGHKISIVSAVPQTTRNKVRGILTREQGQLVFLDTPGYHDSDKKLNLYLKDIALSSLEETDVILYIIDSTRKPGVEERSLVEQLSKLKKQLIIGLNKSDMNHDAVLLHQELLTEFDLQDKAFRISALTGDGLDELIQGVFDLAPEGDQMYPDEFFTDQDPQFRIAELIREKAINLVSQEVPHSLYVDIADMENRRDEAKDREILWIRAFLVVERESQKGILVGRQGSVIKKIRQEAQKDIGKLFPYRIHLDLRVKTNPKWRKRDNILKDLIY